LFFIIDEPEDEQMIKEKSNEDNNCLIYRDDGRFFRLIILLEKSFVIFNDKPFYIYSIMKE
jgi:hypothetical protein